LESMRELISKRNVVRWMMVETKVVRTIDTFVLHRPEAFMPLVHSKSQLAEDMFMEKVKEFNDALN